MDSRGGSERRKWWDVRWSRSEAFRNERRQFVILSVLGGLVFFGAGLFSGVISTNAAASRAGSLSSTSTKSASIPMEKGAVESARLDALDVVTTEASEKPKELKVHMYNSYTENNSIELYPWEHMAEPHKPSTMELLDWPASDDTLEYRWVEARGEDLVDYPVFNASYYCSQR